RNRQVAQSWAWDNRRPPPVRSETRRPEPWPPPASQDLKSPFSFLCSFVWLHSRPSPLAQPEIILRLVQRHGDFTAPVVGRHCFGDTLPVGRSQVRRGFKAKIGIRQRPGKSEAVVGM